MATKAAKPKGQYELTEAPPAPSGSRFALPKTAAGFSVPGGVAGVVAVEYGHLSKQRRQDAIAHRPSLVSVKLKAVKRTADGGFELVERGEVSALPTYENSRPSLRWRKMEGDGGAFLDSFFLGEDAWKSAPDTECFDAMLALAQTYRAGWAKPAENPRLALHRGRSPRRYQPSRSKTYRTSSRRLRVFRSPPGQLREEVPHLLQP